METHFSVSDASVVVGKPDHNTTVPDLILSVFKKTVLMKLPISAAIWRSRVSSVLVFISS